MALKLAARQLQDIQFTCQACQEFKAPQTRNVVASHGARPGEVEIGGTQWRHPITGADVVSRCVMVKVLDETLQRLSSSKSTREFRDGLIDGWMCDRTTRPKFVRLDPAGAYVCSDMH